MMIRIILVAVACFIFNRVCIAELSVASPFSSNMVLQRDREIPVWGHQTPGMEITVQLAGQTAEAKADKTGYWNVSFSPLPAGGAYTLRIRSGNELIAIQNVTMGDVWICSGQSNMEWPLHRSLNAENEIAEAFHPGIRLLNISHKASPEPVDFFPDTWRQCTPKSVPGFSAVGYFFGRMVYRTTGVPIGLISTNWGGTPAESWTPVRALEANPDFAVLLKRRSDFLKKEQAWIQAGSPQRGPEEMKSHRPALIASMLYNGMISPLIKFPIKGVIWYQGESNAGRAQQYEKLFPAMIQSWRTAWNQGDFPFYFVQLANFRARNEQPVEDAWAELRDAQTQALKLPETGMAVAIDIGEAKSIHPRNKQEVGRRLALWALSKDYRVTEPDGLPGRLPVLGGYFRKPLVCSGPLYRDSEVQGNAISIRFTHTADGLRTRDGKALKGFAIAGKDRKFVWADARIEGDRVIVSHPEISAPVAVRYGWSINPEVNLIHSAGLPASPFRTDDWPGLTDGRR